MSTETCSAVTVTNVLEEGGDVANASDRVVLMLDMSSETFAGSVNDCIGRPTEYPEIRGRATSDQPIVDMAVRSAMGTVPMASGNTSVCAHCLGSGTSVPLRLMLDSKVEDVISVQDTVQAIDVLAPTVTEISNRQPRKVRRRSRLNKGRSGKKKKSSSRVRAKGSGDTMVTAPPPTSTSPPKVKIPRQVPIDLSSSTDSGDDESSDNNVNNSGDRCRRSGRGVRFNKWTSSNGTIASDVRRQTRQVLQSRDRLSTRSHTTSSQQRLRNHDQPSSNQ